MTITPDDVQVAKDVVIQILTNELLRAHAELAAIRREGEASGSDD